MISEATDESIDYKTTQCHVFVLMLCHRIVSAGIDLKTERTSVTYCCLQWSASVAAHREQPKASHLFHFSCDQCACSLLSSYLSICDVLRRHCCWKINFRATVEIESAKTACCISLDNTELWLQTYDMLQLGSRAPIVCHLHIWDFVSLPCMYRARYTVALILCDGIQILLTWHCWQS